MSKTFLKLLQCHFPKRHPMHKIFNRNTVKISYCCIRNLGSDISSNKSKFWIPANNILDAIADFEMNVLWTINVLQTILYMEQRSLMKPTMNVLYVRIQLYLNFTEIQLRSLCGLWFSGKCFSSKFKSIFPTFTISNLLKAGMNDKILIYHWFYWVLGVIIFANFNLRL